MAKILVADDEPENLKLLKFNLEMEGHTALLASDGTTAVKRIETEHPAMVLLDVMMPGYDGWEVLRRLSALSLRPRPKVIVMTAKVGAAERTKALELGAHDYLSKPFDVEHLLRLIEEILSLSDAEVEERRLRLLAPGN